MNEKRYWDSIACDSCTQSEMESRAFEYLDSRDFESALQESSYNFWDIVQALRILESPIYDDLLAIALENIKKDYFSEDEGDEEND